MQYVFFDIECACVYKDTAKICAFGYCLTDEQFNILEKEDLLINPQGKFHLTDGKGREGIVLPYDYSKFGKYPTFSRVYPKIRRLLESKDHIVLGHATTNDVKYLTLETKRFHLPAFKFDFYDTQIMYMANIHSFERQYGLELIAQDLNVEFTPHRAVDDAYATMRVAEAMCHKEGISLSEFIRKYELIPGRAEHGAIIGVTSREKELFLEEKRLAKEARDQLHIEFCRYVETTSHKKGFVKNNDWKGKVFTFSREIEYDIERAKKYIDVVYTNGGKYTTKSENCTVYLRAETDSGKRLQNAQRMNAEIWQQADLDRYL